MSENLDLEELREIAQNAAALETEHGYTLPYVEAMRLMYGHLRASTVLALIDRVEAAEVSVSNQRSAVKALAERNVELTKFKDAYSLQAQELEQAEAERDFRQKENKELFEQIERVREVAHYSNKVHREAILEALDGGEQE